MNGLKKLANEIRYRIIRNAYLHDIPHVGGCLSSVDILVELYFQRLRIDPSKPLDPDRDRFILSKGHAAPALYQVLAERGFFPISALDDYGCNGSLFGEHPFAPPGVPGVEFATGSLGHGLPLATGLALSAKIAERPHKIFVLLGDGECNEGSIWEAARFAAENRLDNLTAIVDHNGWQGISRTSDTVATLRSKWKSFGWSSWRLSNRPKIEVVRTRKGAGVSFMEDDNEWHYRIPTAAEVEQARIELGVEKS